MESIVKYKHLKVGDIVQLKQEYVYLYLIINIFKKYVLCYPLNSKTKQLIYPEFIKYATKTYIEMYVLQL